MHRTRANARTASARAGKCLTEGCYRQTYGLHCEEHVKYATGAALEPKPVLWPDKPTSCDRLGKSHNWRVGSDENLRPFFPAFYSHYGAAPEGCVYMICFYCCDHTVVSLEEIQAHLDSAQGKGELVRVAA